MSGIVAIVNFDGAPVDPDILKKMAEQCAYRGPDGIRYWIQGNVGLAHLALNATPESLREQQPQRSEDGSLCLTADVRVDNRPELIELLNRQGFPVTAHATDADLLLASYQAWGERCPEEVIGDYAFAIWDARKQQLFAARDIYGVKSLHYSRHGSLLCVASEAQQIIQHPGIPRKLDEIAVADFLVRNYNDEGHTMFQDVWAVKRANSLVADATGQRMQRYWDIDPNKRITYSSDQEYADHFLEIFQRAVSDRLRTNGETIGITMSGGLDLTSIAAVAQQIIKSQSDKPHLVACSYAFDTLKECDERFYSQHMADDLGIELNYVPAENFWFLDNEITYTPTIETPYLTTEDSVTISILSIFKDRKAHVWLTGHGGDNLLTGSPLIYTDRFRKGELAVLSEVFYLWKRSKTPISKLLQIFQELFVKPFFPDFLRQFKKKLIKHKKPKVIEFLNDEFARRTHILERLSDFTSNHEYKERSRRANYNLAVITDSIQIGINWAERMGTRFMMETRHPFLDRRLTEYLLAIPPGLLFRGGYPKYILRKAMQGKLPEVIRTRTNKTEFTKYVNLGFSRNEIGMLWALFEFPLLNKLNLVKLAEISGMFEDKLFEKNNIYIRISISFISLVIWLRKYYIKLFN